ncbi:MAG: MaoC family dehydratase [Candidatus Eremiobacteraeota bacterium]|nr:MaoC family dehydratase [Candidatus Eremiobacteraeota bacterium]
MKFLEDFPIGVRRELGSKLVAEDEIVRFAREFDPQPFHVDAAAAKDSFYGGIIASGWHTCSMTMRIMVDGFLSGSASMGSPGIDELRWLKPVRPGDRLTVFSTVESVQLSKSKPDRGFLRTLTEVENQTGDVVLSMRGNSMIRKRPVDG